MTRDKTFMGDALSFIKTLPSREGHQALAHLEVYGDLPKFLHKNFHEFLRCQYHDHA